jgi:cyclopropane fatty-acyl-phospholipid synthase-like methyltransferase
MAERVSKRLMEIVDALPLKEGMRVLEIGCGPGAAAREICRRMVRIDVVAIDRSEKAIRQAIEGSKKELQSGRLSLRQVAIEDFELGLKEKRFDLAFAVRVGALDGRHPELEKQALERIAKSLKANGRFFIDGGNPLKEILLNKPK